MIKNLKIIAKLLAGYFFCAFGIVMSINANLGVGPWNAFHLGLSYHTKLSLGQVQIMVGFIIMVSCMLFGIIPGIGTIGNMSIIGILTDFINKLSLIPKCEDYFWGMVMLLLSMFFTAFGTFLYMSAGLGSGPRDGLMVMILKVSGKPIWLVRNSIEAIVLIIGIILGAPIGLGTLVYCIGIGYIMQFVFKIFSFNPKQVCHKTLSITLK